MNSLRYSVFQGALALVAGAAITPIVASMGISKPDWQLLTGPDAWLVANRNRVTAMLQTLVWGMMDISGVPRFNPSAEYIAAVIAVVCSPNNTSTACGYLAGSLASADSILAGDQPPEQIDPARLHALVCMAMSDNLSDFKQAFEDSVGKKLSHVYQQPAVPVDQQAGGAE